MFSSAKKYVGNGASEISSKTRRSLDAMLCTPRSALSGIVRDVRRRSLRKRKLWVDSKPSNSVTHASKLKSFTPGKSQKMSKSCCSKVAEDLQLNSYKKLRSPLYSPNVILFSSTKENSDPRLDDVKKQRRSSLFTPKSTRFSISRQSSIRSNIFGQDIPICEGYLLKKSVKWKTFEFNSKYVCLTSDGTLNYYPSYKAFLEDENCKSLQLNTATVKCLNESCDDNKSFFEVISSNQTQWIFGCKSQTERDLWIKSIREEIKSTLQGPEEVNMKHVLDPDLGNNCCADCGDENPEWASVNIGVVLCIECSGIHRNLGSHISQVRSLHLDNLSKEQVDLLKSVGNKRFNTNREGQELIQMKPTHSDCYSKKHKFIEHKYKGFCHESIMNKSVE